MEPITRIAKISNGAWGKGTITHEDQKVAGIKFKVLYTSSTDTYLAIRGYQQELLKWSKRTGAVQVTKQDVLAVQTAEAPAVTTCDMGHEHPYVKPSIDETKL